MEVATPPMHMPAATLFPTSIRPANLFGRGRFLAEQPRLVAQSDTDWALCFTIIMMYKFKMHWKRCSRIR